MAFDTAANKISLGNRSLRVAAPKKVSDKSSEVKIASLEAMMSQQTELISVLIGENKKIVQEQIEMKKQIEVSSF